MAGKKRRLRYKSTKENEKGDKKRKTNEDVTEGGEDEGEIAEKAAVSEEDEEEEEQEGESPLKVCL